MKKRKWSSQWTQLCNCVKKPEKNPGLQRDLNLWLAITGAMPYPLSYEATDVGSRSIVGSYVPVKEIWPVPNVSGFIAQLVEHRTGNNEVRGSNPVEVLDFFQASLRNCINCVHCGDHFFIFISFPQFIYDLFHISLAVLFNLIVQAPN